MKGLFLKDFYGTKPTLKVFSVVIVVAIALSFFMDISGYLLVYSSIFALMVVLQSMTEDEKSGWNKYAIGLPISRSSIAFSKYAISFFCIGISNLGILIGMLISPSMAQALPAEMILGSLTVSVLYVLIMIPLTFKYGVAKSRLLILFAVYVPIFIVYLVGEMGLDIEYIKLLETYIYMVPIMMIVLLVISFMVSMRICETKEF